MNRRGKTIRLARLKDSSCKRCKLCKSSRHVCILGKGNVMASIMLIGEAPGAAEERTGKVFCGRAGKFLDKLLNSLDMKDRVYITNAVRCRPSDNRKPTSEEIHACQKYLDGELGIIKPKVILLLGRTAIEAMGFGADVNAGSEGFLVNETWWAKGTWHPSYCLRRGKAATRDLFKALLWARERSK